MLTGFVVALLGCQPENLNPQETPQKADGARKELKTAGVKFNGEYLEFKNPAVYEEFMKALPSQNTADLNDWEQKLGFRSMRNYFETAIAENAKYHDWLRKNMNAELAKQIRKNSTPQSDFAKQHANLFLTDEHGNPHLNLYDPILSSVLNKEGIVKVGRYIFQYTMDYMKVMPADKKDKIQTFKKAIQDDPQNGIVVKKILKTFSQKISQGGRVEAHNFSACGYGYYVTGLPPRGLQFAYVSRKVDGCVNLYTTYTPIYSCDDIMDPKRYYDCVTDEQNPPYIVRWEISQTLNVSAKQNERTFIPLSEYIPFDIEWQGEAQTLNLGIQVNTNYLGGSANTASWPAANVYHSASHQVISAYNITGTVEFSGDGGLPTPIVIN